MSEAFITRRGGAGSGKAFAVIGVTYPSGSTVTCTNGTKTLTTKDTTGTTLFVIPSAGTWTVTAVNGSQSASKSVSITTEGQVESVTLSFETVLVPNDSYATLWTGATTNTAYGKFTIARDSIYVKYNDRGRTYVQTANKIACEADSTIVINVSAFTNDAEDYNGKSYLYASTKAPSSVSDLSAYTQITATGKATLSIETAGSFYIGILNVITGGGGSYPTEELSTTVNSFVLK